MQRNPSSVLECYAVPMLYKMLVCYATGSKKKPANDWDEVKTKMRQSYARYGEGYRREYACACQDHASDLNHRLKWPLQSSLWPWKAKEVKDLM